MAGFRVLAVILGLICLAMALGLFFQKQPVVIKVRDIIVQERALRNFIDTGNVVVRDHLKYAITGCSVFALGLGLMFFISAFNPLGMRPFIVVVMIACIIWIPLVIWKGLSLNITKLWWIGDAASCLILVILLAAFFPKHARPVGPGEEEKLEE